MRRSYPVSDLRGVKSVVEKTQSERIRRAFPGARAEMSLFSRLRGRKLRGDSLCDDSLGGGPLRERRGVACAASL